MAEDKLARGQRREDFNLSAQHKDKPRAAQPREATNKTDEEKWERGQQRPEFNRATLGKKKRSVTGRAPATREELRRREAARARPHKQAQLTPGNSTEQFVHEKSANDNEKRIKQIRKRLARARHKARDDFGHGR